MIGFEWCVDCQQSPAGVCGAHGSRTYSVGADAWVSLQADLYDYDAAAAALIARLGWDESDWPEVVEALKAARCGEQVKR